MRAKLPYEVEAEYHEMIREGSQILTNGNKTQFIREAIEVYFKEAKRVEEEK